MPPHLTAAAGKNAVISAADTQQSIHRPQRPVRLVNWLAYVLLHMLYSLLGLLDSILLIKSDWRLHYGTLKKGIHIRSTGPRTITITTTPMPGY
jgi:hypothetical protein